MSAARQARDLAAEADRLVRALEAMHLQVAAGRVLRMSESLDMLAAARSVQNRAHMAAAACAVHLPAGQTLTLPDRRAPNLVGLHANLAAQPAAEEVRRFISEHTELAPEVRP